MAVSTIAFFDGYGRQITSSTIIGVLSSNATPAFKGTADNETVSPALHLSPSRLFATSLKLGL